MNQAAIRERLKLVGAEALCDLVCRQAYYGALYGIEADDLLQEAIVTHLSGGDVALDLGRLRNVKRYETPLDEIFVSTVAAQVDEPQDWIPDDPIERLRLISDCEAAIERSYKDQVRIRGGYQARLRLRSRSAFIGYYENNQERGEAVREALERIIGWCTD